VHFLFHCSPNPDFFSLKRFVRFVMWCEIIAGWGFSLLFVAVVSGLARRKE